VHVSLKLLWKRVVWTALHCAVRGLLVSLKAALLLCSHALPRAPHMRYERMQQQIQAGRQGPMRTPLRCMVARHKTAQVRSYITELAHVDLRITQPSIFPA
jgi:hypothetical protein